ncbi:MAG: PQQ-binding-like beta-propeller repeat protein [Acidobacteriota bacterium]|nr:MAG: PQQ-binding-like beta-propeller repeat protein [Acidobacteriota bacterium]
MNPHLCRRGKQFCCALVCCYLALTAAALRTASSQVERLYTQAQAERGKSLYGQHCASCHGQSLEGTPASPLAGERFLAKWSDRTLDELYFITKMQMPYGKPDSLPAQQYLDIVAFMLASNGYAAGERELTADAARLKQIKLTRQSGAPVTTTAAPTSFKSGAKASTVNPTQAELNAARNTTDWLMPNHDYGGQRFVDLKQINRRNAASLQPVAIYQIADANAFHNNPLVYQGVLYVATTNATMALDAATLKVKWRVDRKPKGPDGWPVNRGVALKDGKLVRGTHDGYLLAYDAADGKLLWERPVSERKKRETGFTMAPLIFEDLILIGPAGSEAGVKGWVGAFRLEDGEQVWRFNTVPDAGEPGAETWKDAAALATGGGSVWAPFSLDAEKGVLYVPVSNPAPDFYTDSRFGSNLYTNSLLAFDVRTGKLQWYYQAVPADFHDWDVTQVSPLFEAKVNGKMRRLVTVTGKDGLLHVLDRETHEHLYEVPVTTRTNPNVPLTATQGVYACPGVLGGVQWNGPAYNPGLNTLFVNAVDWCGKFLKAREYRAGVGGYMGGIYTADPLEKSRGWLTAIDASTGQIRWKYSSERPMLAAVTTTSAELIMTGELTGDFLVLDGRDGKVLYRFNCGGPLNGGVITYAVNGRQYIAVNSGNATGFWRAAKGSATVLLFALPESKSPIKATPAKP